MAGALVLRCLNPICIPELPLDKLIEVAGRWGYDAVEFPAQSACAFRETGALDRVRRRSRELEVIPYACSGIIARDSLRPVDLMCDADTYETAKRDMGWRLAAAKELGAELATVTMGPKCPQGARDMARDEACERLATICEAAGRWGLRVAVEFTGVQLVRPPRLYDSIEEFLDLTAKVSPQLGVVFDSWHWFNSGWNCSDLFRLCARPVLLVHLNDAPEGTRPPQPDRARLLPGETTLGISGIKGMLPAKAAVSIEVFDDGLRALDVDQACERLDRAWGQVLK